MGKCGGSSKEIPQYTKCGKKHVGKCLMGTNICFGCEKSGRIVKYCPMDKDYGRESNQAQACDLNSSAPIKNCFYALKCRSD